MLNVLALDKLRHQLPPVLTREKHEPSIGNALERGLNHCLILIPESDLPALHCFDQCLYGLVGSRYEISNDKSSDLRIKIKTVSSVRPFSLL